jgi:hypothetical protein
MNSRDETGKLLESAILDLLSQRGSGKTICPSEAARRVDSQRWQDLMPQARAVAERLSAQGRILITQRGKVVDPSRVKGPIRLKMH